MKKKKVMKHGGSGMPPETQAEMDHRHFMEAKMRAQRPRLSTARLDWDPVLDAMRGIPRPMSPEEFREECIRQCERRRLGLPPWIKE